MSIKVNSNSFRKLMWFLIISGLLLVSFQALLTFSSSISESTIGLGSGIFVTLILVFGTVIVAFLAFTKGGFYKYVLVFVLCISVFMTFLTLNGSGFIPQRLVGAYYYVWYQGNQWTLTGWQPSEDLSILGQYDSGNVTVITQHINWAKQYGINFFVVSLWPNSGNINSFSFNNTKTVFKTNAEMGNPIKLCILLEPTASNQLQSLADEVYNDFVPYSSYLYWGGKPLLMVYTERISLLTRWTDSRFTVKLVPLDVPYITTNVIPQNPISIQTTFVSDFISVNPGENKTSTGTYVDRQNGAYYTAQWNFANTWAKLNLQRSLAVIITSWNEWIESTAIEKSVQYGSQYLQLTKTYSDEFRST